LNQICRAAGPLTMSLRKVNRRPHRLDLGRDGIDE